MPRFPIAVALCLSAGAALACPDADRMDLPLGFFRDTVCAPEHRMAPPLWIVQIDEMQQNWIADVTEIGDGRLAAVGALYEGQEPVGFLQVIDAAGRLTGEGLRNGLGLPEEVVWTEDQGVIIRDGGKVIRWRDGETKELEFGSSMRTYDVAGMDITPEGDLVVLSTEYGPFDPEVHFWTFRPRDTRDAFGEEVDDLWQAHALVEADPEADRVVIVGSEETGAPWLVISDEDGKLAEERGWIGEDEDLVSALPDGEGGAWIVTRRGMAGRANETAEYAHIAWWRAGSEAAIVPQPEPAMLRPQAAMALPGDGMLLAGTIELQQGAMRLPLPAVWAVDGEGVARGWIPIGQPGQMRIAGLDATSDGRLILWGERFPEGAASPRSTGFVVAWEGADFVAPMRSGD